MSRLPDTGAVSIRRTLSIWVMGATLSLLAACGGSTHTQTTSTTTAPPDAPLASFSVAGRVSGLTGAGLSLSLNGGPALAIAGDGSFVFPTEISDRFIVTVASAAAGQTCTVSHATGASVSTDVDTIRVNCSGTAHAVRGSVSGLAAGQQLTLTNNGADPVVLLANGAYAFPAGVARNGGYAVAVNAQPTGQTCTVSNATGAGVVADTTNVDVLCANTSYRVGGAVSGLATGATVTLLNNGSDATVVLANGTYVFATGVADHGNFSVTVGTQPAGQTCTVSNAQGVNVANDVNTVNVTCDAVSYTVGGTLSGLLANQQITLFNNGADPLTLSANGAFEFATPIAAQGAYAVSQGAATAGMTCNLSNQSGSNVTANATNVGLSCSTPAVSFVYIPDYGNARVLGYRIDRSTGAQTNLPGSPYAAGTNNRWIAMNPAQTFLYTTNGGGNSVSAYTINTTTGALTAVAGSPFATGATPSSLEVSPDGRFAFVANANGGSVSGYSIDQATGALTPLPGSPYAAGIIPTKIAITADSGFLYVTNQNGGNVSAYSIDATTGALAPLSGSPYAVAQQPYGIALHPSGNFLYVPSFQGVLNVFRVDTVTGALTDLMPGGYASTGSDWGLQAFTTNAAGTVGYLATNQGVRAYDIDTTSGALTVRTTLQITGVVYFVTTNAARTRLYASDFITIRTHIAEINDTNGNLTSVAGSPFSVGARPYNLGVIER